MIVAEDFLRLAGKLAAVPSADEAQIRTAISRAYYAAFHAAKGCLTAIGVRIGHNHGELQRFLLESAHSQAVEAGKQLADLHTFRIKADYELSDRIVGSRRFAQDCVETAAEIVAILKELNREPHRQQIKAGIEAYRRKIGRA